MLRPCGPLRMSHTLFSYGVAEHGSADPHCQMLLTSASWQSVTCLLQCLNRNILQTWSPHFNLASNSLICHQYELVKIPGLPVLKAMSLALVKVGTFPWTLDWRCAHNRYQPIWSLLRHWCYQLVCSPILGSNDISWLLGLKPGLTFSSRAKPSILTGKLTWQ